MSKEKLKLSKYIEMNDDIFHFIRNKLRDFNLSQVGAYSKNKPLLLIYRNQQNQIIAGLYAYLGMGMLYIDLLWVDENYRGQQLGSKLLEQTEKYAKEQEALYIRVNTATFQALDFYLKHDYEVFAKLPLKIEGHDEQYDYYLLKYLQ